MSEYQIVPFPKIRRLMVDGGQLARQKHLIHGLIEVDVTAARQIVRTHKAMTGETLSFTAFILACLGRAIDQHKQLLTYRTWGGNLVVFDDADVNTMFEVEVDGQKIIRPHIIRAVNRKSFREIHEEIRAFQQNHASGQEGKWIDRFVLLPACIRRLALHAVLKTPRWLQNMNGTVSLTSVGMFGQGGGWGIPVSNHTLQVTVGGIEEKPAFIGKNLEKREFLSMTISLDHDMVDGAPAARFVQALKTMLENRYGLEQYESRQFEEKK